MSLLGEKWRRFWFAVNDPSDLAICRILFFAIVAYLCWNIDFVARAEVDEVFWMPILLFKVYQLPLFSATTIAALALIWKGALLTSCVGLFTRFSTLVSWLLGVYLLGMVNCFGKISHQSQMIVIILAIMALARCGDAFSLDRLWLRWIRKEPELDDELCDGGIYSWPGRLAHVVFISVFFAAGVAKLRTSGLSWAFSDNMANVLIAAQYGTENVWNRLGPWIAQHAWLCQAMALSSLLLELAAPLALFSRRARPVLIGGLFLMQTGIFIFMGTNFTLYLAGYAFWVPWSVVLARIPLGSKRTRPFAKGLMGAS